MPEHQNAQPWPSDPPAPAAHPAPWLTVCSACRDWVDGVYHVTPDGQRLCRDCTPPAFLPPDPGAPKKPPYVGPPAPWGSLCPCGRPAVARCQACLQTFCTPCWWRHSHAGQAGGPAARTQPNRTGGDEHEH